MSTASKATPVYWSARYGFWVPLPNEQFREASCKELQLAQENKLSGVDSGFVFALGPSKEPDSLTEDTEDTPGLRTIQDFVQLGYDFLASGRSDEAARLVELLPLSEGTETEISVAEILVRAGQPIDALHRLRKLRGRLPDNDLVIGTYILACQAALKGLQHEADTALDDMMAILRRRLSQGRNVMVRADILLVTALAWDVTLPRELTAFYSDLLPVDDRPHTLAWSPYESQHIDLRHPTTLPLRAEQAPPDVLTIPPPEHVVQSASAVGVSPLETGFVDVAPNTFAVAEPARIYMAPGAFGLVEIENGVFAGEGQHGAFNPYMGSIIKAEGDLFLRDGAHPFFKENTLRRLEGSYILPFREAGVFYFHFLTETLQVIHEAASVCPTSMIMLPRSPSFFNRINEQVYREAVDCVLGPNQSVTYVDNGIYEVDRLTIPCFWRYGRLSFVEKVLDSLGIRRAPSGEAIFIQRQKDAARFIHNEHVLVAAIREFLPHLKVVQLEVLPFSEQVKVFAEADLVIAAHGGGLANMVFCGPQTAIFEICTQTSGRMYRDLAFILHMPYFAYVAATIQDGGDTTIITDEVKLSRALQDFVRTKDTAARPSS